MNRIFWIKDSSQQPGDDNDLDDQQNAGKKTDDLSKKSTKMRVINTNARSLCPKIDSLVDVMEESDASLAVVTETWLKDGDRLDEDVDGLSRGRGSACYIRTGSRSRTVFPMEVLLFCWTKGSEVSRKQK